MVSDHFAPLQTQYPHLNFRCFVWEAERSSNDRTANKSASVRTSTSAELNGGSGINRVPVLLQNAI
jgi:hypothetical protein